MMLLFFTADDVGAALLLLVIIVGGLLSLGLYFLPTIIAVKRNHPQMAPIIVLNFLAGWTFVGWVVAIVWAVSNFEKSYATASVPASQPPRDFHYKKLG